ncbi:hypothetical protein NDU88_006673 [Pleurodeles waltl]|uniref:Uncharacterized protein n=1 Tax=Pleurodeles waltl TaxID=8319 RepID=A0AAV7VMK4_PLEWA|nr:hypothetical protein NDU88_006673 [Pleurodeles waltl]
MRCTGSSKVLNGNATAPLHSCTRSHMTRESLPSPAVTTHSGAPLPHPMTPPGTQPPSLPPAEEARSRAARGSAGHNRRSGRSGEPNRLPRLTASLGSLYGLRLPPDRKERGSIGAGGRGASGLHNRSAMLAGPTSQLRFLINGTDYIWV